MDENKATVVKTYKKRNIYYMVIYIILFYAAWTLKEAFLAGIISDSIKPNINVMYLIMGCVKVVLWILPVFFYLRFIDNESPLSYLKMNRNVKKGLIWGIVICLAYIAFSLLKKYLSEKSGFNLDLDLDQCLNTVILAGFTEEIVFRGFLLQKFEEFSSSVFKGLDKETAFWAANIITSLLFVFIHFPRWYFNDHQILIQSMISVFILGIAFGYTFKKTGSIWASMIFHSTNNFIVVAILSKALS